MSPQSKRTAARPIYRLVTAAALLSLLAAGGCGPSDGRAIAATSPAPAPNSAGSATAGSLDIAASGQTVGRNSKGDANSVQCQLHFSALNQSALDIKSLIVNYDALNRSTGVVVKSGLQFVIPVVIKAGSTGAPFGSETIDNVRCEDLRLRFGPQPGFQCRTSTKAPCAAFHYRDNGVAVESPR